VPYSRFAKRLDHSQ